MPPPKSEPRLGTGARGMLLTGLSEDNSAPASVQVQYRLHGTPPQPHICGHESTHVLHMPSDYVHYAKVCCAKCNRFIRWISRPENVKRARLNSSRIEKLSIQKGLSDWEYSFLESISHQPRLSPKQQAVLDRIAAEHREVAP